MCESRCAGAWMRSVRPKVWVLFAHSTHSGDIRGVPADGYRWVEAMLQLADRTSEAVSPASRAQAFMFGGIIARTQGDLAMAQTFLERCVAISRTLDDDLGLAYGLMNLGMNQLFGGEFEPGGCRVDRKSCSCAERRRREPAVHGTDAPWEPSHTCRGSTIAQSSSCARA